MTHAKELFELVDSQVINGMSDEAQARKNKFHRLAKAVAKSVAKALGFDKGTYSIRSNAGGRLVSGEVILHSESLYIEFSVDYLYRQFLYRTCKGTTDYTGGRNHWMEYWTLGDEWDEAIAEFHRLIDLAKTGPTDSEVEESDLTNSNSPV